VYNSPLAGSVGNVIAVIIFYPILIFTVKSLYSHSVDQLLRRCHFE
jgi:hypothetical protein